MPRSLMFLGILQIACLLVGFFALGIILKVSGYPEDLPMIRWSPLAIYLRTHGLWLLALPAVWVIYAVYSARSDKGVFSVKISIIVGFLLSAAIILSFLYAAIFPFSRVMHIVP